tara:strand:+ start:1381 stop:1596 length:216 start_codon:yes stop_codon:yes gene_type:complete
MVFEYKTRQRLFSIIYRNTNVTNLKKNKMINKIREEILLIAIAIGTVLWFIFDDINFMTYSTIIGLLLYNK